MNFKGAFLCLFIGSLQFIYAESSTYFLKYKNFVDQSEISDRVFRKKFLSEESSNALFKNRFTAEYFARGLAKNIKELSSIVKITFSYEDDAVKFFNQAVSDPLIEYIQKSNIYQIDFTPNDSLLSQQWALNKIKAFDAWNITLGSDSIPIAIIDTGIDFDHPDLSSKIFFNRGEMGVDQNGFDKQSNNFDDDNNGFIDDYMGWDFTDRVGFPFDSTGGDYLGWDNLPNDEHGHGTYIAGIAGASANNLKGVAGIAPYSKLLNVRAFDPNGFGEEDDVAAAILYSVQMGAKVINMSFGDNAFSFVLRDVIRYAYSKGVVLVASAGNSGSSLPHYPSGYSEVICVANSTSDDYISGSSNFGSTIDIAAPGSSILTTSKNNEYAIISGTSASAPFVSGAAALILSVQNFSNEEIKQIIKSTADDIDIPGWDMKSGAGRLNLSRALTVIAPSKIKINFPTQDYATSSNSININATVLSAYFIRYELYYGIGLNPTSWVTLISNGQNQLSGENIFNLNTAEFKDTVYNLRLVVYLSNGKTLEERANFYIDRSPPIANLILAAPAFYGNKTTLLAAVQANEAAIVRMYYKREGESKFNFITLDGFSTNNQFVKQIHYGFIPKHLVEQNNIYNIYFEVENLVGLKSKILIGNDSILNIPAFYNFEPLAEYEMPFSLPKGTIYKNPTNFLSQFFNELLFNEFYPTQNLFYGLYKLEGNDLVKIDSIMNRLPRDVGDFNNDGKIDLLSSIQRNGYIDEQSASNNFTFTNKYSDSSGAFWPIMAADIDNDSNSEILAVNSDTSIIVWHVNSDLSLSLPIILPNYTSKGFGANILDSPHCIVIDEDNDGKKEIWLVDRDGDIFSYEYSGANIFSQNKVFSTEFQGSSSLITSGDYDGDGVQEIAVLIHSIEDIDIAPFYRLLIFNFKNDNLNILFDQAFIDASVEFNASFRPAESSIRFVDLDLNGKDELVVFVFPYAYILEYTSLKSKIISYKENINSNTIFVGDLNGNGIPELAFPGSNGINFFEFSFSQTALAPFNLAGYSIDSSRNLLTWEGNAEKFYIFKGNSSSNQILTDSTTANVFVDSFVTLNDTYFYSIQAFDPSKTNPLSNLSSVIEVYTHAPAKIINVNVTSLKSIAVAFSERISNTIDNLSAFDIPNLGNPNSISPKDQKSLLLTFNQDIPFGENSLVVKSMKDYYGSPIKPDTILFKADSIPSAKETFFISSHQLLNPYKLKIVFSLEVDSLSASNYDNYIFTPDNKVTSVDFDTDDKQVIYLSWQAKPVGSLGKEYVLRLTNLQSSAKFGNIQIASGAGSYIVLTGFANDLSDVFVYPQPAINSKGDGKLTFANLPRKAQIIIMNLEGKKMIEAEENDGNGGIEINLKDKNGELFNSGVYLYRIIQLDDSGNNIQEKLGKFVVLR